MRRHCLAFCLFLIAPLAQAADVQGLWVGYYEYEDGTRVVCSMALAQGDEITGGTMVEPQTFGNELDPGKPAYILGEVDGSSLDFEKYYALDEGRTEPVVYEMRISPDGHTMTGFWTIGEASGRAWFRRVSATTVERLPVPN